MPALDAEGWWCICDGVIFQMRYKEPAQYHDTWESLMVIATNESQATWSDSRLLDIIKTQTEIAKLGMDLGAVMALVAERAQQLTSAIGAVIELAESDDMIYRAASGLAAPHLGMRLQRRASLSGYCIEQGRALYCEDSEADDRVNREACRQIGLRSMVVVPLRHHDNIVGVLKVLSETPKAFNDADMKLLELMSEVIAASMFHASKYEESELFFRATHDALTGLPNRALFFERLHHRLAEAQRGYQPFGLLNLDMDGLKPINDKLGHRAGDAAIKALAARIKEASRTADTVARVGGDEFGVILNSIDDRHGAQTHLTRLVEHIAQPFEFEDKSIPLDASVGLAVYPNDGSDLNRLLDVADHAMYEAKRAKPRLVGL
jgi:diguanylate cyclase (GGDEF)-like protein